jgi:hypothetical protein
MNLIRKVEHNGPLFRRICKFINTEEVIKAQKDKEYKHSYLVYPTLYKNSYTTNYKNSYHIYPSNQNYDDTYDENYENNEFNNEWNPYNNYSHIGNIHHWNNINHHNNINHNYYNNWNNNQKQWFKNNINSFGIKKNQNYKI